MIRMKTLLLLIVCACLLTTLGCGRSVKRISPDEVTDLSGYWNDTDSRLVSEEMISDCLNGRWKDEHQRQKGTRPTVIVGMIRNKSTEHIAIETFTGDIERAFINSGEVLMVASAEEREQIREERADQHSYASDETIKEWGKEKGADYMLGGVINSIIDQVKGEKVVYYQVDLTLIDLETNSKVWAGQKKIKKFIDNPGYGL